MPTVEEWIKEHRPSDDPDYQRLTEVTKAIESEALKVGPKAALGRRFDYDVALRHGMRRTEETSRKVKLENPEADALLDPLTRGWTEGFVFGALTYSKERRGREPEELLDRIALANINHHLATSDDAERTEIWTSTVSTAALGYVSVVRSLQAEQILRTLRPTADHQAVKSLIASHWLDAFLVGMVFQELGGHRKT